MPSDVPPAAVVRCSRGSALSRPRISLELWSWAPAASRHLPRLPLSLGTCVNTSCPQRKNIELGTELPRGSPRAPGQGKRLSLFKPPVPHRRDGETDETTRWDPYRKLNPPSHFSLTAPGGQGPHVLHVTVSHQSHRNLPTAIPDRHLPN